jgi:hypothetical protein
MLRKRCRDIIACTRDPSLDPWGRKERALIRRRQMDVLNQGVILPHEAKSFKAVVADCSLPGSGEYSSTLDRATGFCRLLECLI